MEKCRLWLTTEEIKQESLKGATVVVIDVLLATTTLVTIMERGARRVFPVSSVEEAHQLKAELNHSSVLTGGELGAKPVEGFDLAHLPDEYTPERVKDQDIVFLSSNGTRAIMKAKAADTLLLGNLRNAYAIADYINQESPKEVIIVCAGSLGQFSLEDYVCANIILSQLNVEGSSLNDAAVYALDQRFDPNNVAQIVSKGRVGRNFQKLGLDELFEFVVDVGCSESIVGLHNEAELGFMSIGSETK
ncbi:2-phosphosulfolactate phosphatase [Salicibibacter kimchii]|uniref:Probable 2-phosphosulfolactate phosphatase n=1 Tax=Salicibibacter kimchii TaxID=2099786 RepID=A0A345BWR0_9BACI|nr:2-phosphosulfolactate phosphatase [Salicibibacter kimchii]AXF55391.1 2-phosphosulfolactate phosphatase [Salicibibacter kimchii]